MAQKALTAVIQEASIQGISTHSVDVLVRAMGATGVSQIQVSRLCKEIYERMSGFLDRPIEGEWLYLWIDATYVKVRVAGRIVLAAVIMPVASTTTGDAKCSAWMSVRLRPTLSGPRSCASFPGAVCAPSNW